MKNSPQLVLLLIVFALVAASPGKGISGDLSALISAVELKTPGKAPARGERWPLPPGPWGDLEACQLVLEPPDQLIDLSGVLINYHRGTTWRFPSRSVEEVRDLLRRAGIDRATVERVTGPDHLDSRPRGIHLSPPPDVIEGMTRTVRGNLYSHLLSVDPLLNQFSLDPDGFERIALDAGLSRDTIRLITGLSYFVHGSRFFSDIEYVMQRAADDTERRRILTTLGREYCLTIRLDLAESHDWESVTDYWSAEGHYNASLPILESFRRTEGAEKLDIFHLLPPLPRQLLNTFATSRMAIGEKNPDCYWTAFNFFSVDPSNRVFDHTFFDETFRAHYGKVSGPLRFGDIILIWDKESGAPLHACNYIAGNTVFSKNGSHFRRPWVLIRFADVMSRYMVTDQITVSAFRRK